MEEEALDFSSFPPEEEEEDFLGLSRPLEGEPGGENDSLVEEEVADDDEPFAFPSSLAGFSFFGEGFFGDFVALCVVSRVLEPAWSPPSPYLPWRQQNHHPRSGMTPSTAPPHCRDAGMTALGKSAQTTSDWALSLIHI